MLLEVIERCFGIVLDKDFGTSGEQIHVILPLLLIFQSYKILYNVSNIGIIL